MNAGKKRVLAERAKALAAEEKAIEASDDLVEVVEFSLSSEHYAFETAYVREVCPLKDPTPVPCTPSFVLGLLNVRGRILSVVDLRRLFDLPVEVGPDNPKALILRDEGTEFAVSADAVLGGRLISVSGLLPSLPTLTGLRMKYLKGLTGDGLIVLDAAAVLGDKDLIVNEEVES